MPVRRNRPFGRDTLGIRSIGHTVRASEPPSSGRPSVHAAVPCFTRFFSHLPAFGPVLPHGLSLFQANRVNLFYLFVRERQVFFHPVGHLFATCSVVSSLCSARRLWCPFWAHTVPVASTSAASTTIKNFAFISTTILIVTGLYNRMYSCKPSANLFRQMEKTTYSSLNHEAYSW